jgi:hypothetical protein
LLDTVLAGAWAQTGGEERRRQETRRRTARKEKKGHLEAIVAVYEGLIERKFCLEN